VQEDPAMPEFEVLNFLQSQNTVVARWSILFRWALNRALVGTSSSTGRQLMLQTDLFHKIFPPLGLIASFVKLKGV
jgi:hypothetical protein